MKLKHSSDGVPVKLAKHCAQCGPLGVDKTFQRVEYHFEEDSVFGVAICDHITREIQKTGLIVTHISKVSVAH